jgi:hypothetical protein
LFVRLGLATPNYYFDVFRYFLEKRQHWEQGTKQRQTKQTKNTHISITNV